MNKDVKVQTSAILINGTKTKILKSLAFHAKVTASQAKVQFTVNNKNDHSF